MAIMRLLAAIILALGCPCIGTSAPQPSLGVPTNMPTLTLPPSIMTPNFLPHMLPNWNYTPRFAPPPSYQQTLIPNINVIPGSSHTTPLSYGNASFLSNGRGNFTTPSNNRSQIGAGAVSSSTSLSTRATLHPKPSELSRSLSPGALNLKTFLDNNATSVSSGLPIRIGGGSESVPAIIPGVRSDPSAWVLGSGWFSGKGPRHHEFRRGDQMTELLRKHDHIEEVLKEAATRASSENLNKPFQKNYSLSGLQGLHKYLLDLRTLYTRGLIGNIAVTYLGSYQLEYSIRSLMKGVNGKCLAEVDIQVKNSTTLSSATRVPYIGYTECWERNIGATVNQWTKSGPLSPTTQTFRWTEIIEVPPNQASSIQLLEQPTLMPRSSLAPTLSLPPAANGGRPTLWTR